MGKNSHKKDGVVSAADYIRTACEALWDAAALLDDAIYSGAIKFRANPDGTITQYREGEAHAEAPALK